MPSNFQSRRNASPSETPPARGKVILAAVAVLVVGVGLAAIFMRKDPPAPQPSETAEAPATVPLRKSAAAPPTAPPAEEAPAATVVSAPLPTTPPPPVTPARMEAPAMPAEPALRADVPPALRQLVTGLTQLSESGLAMTPEQAAQWKQQFTQLLQQGTGAIPAIREFLEQNKDFAFTGAAGQALGYSSARAAMIDALTQMGGAEAIAALSDTLRTTALPREVALLARSLDQLEPEVHRQEALAAARQTLAMAAAGKLDSIDVGPAFEVLQRYGGTEAVPDFQNALSRWGYYAAASLAQLPDGAGVPYLAQIAADPAQSQGNKLKAVEGLAQTAGQYPAARATLVELARTGNLPASTWPYLIPFLAGGQYRVVDSVLGNELPPVGTSDLRSIHLAATKQNLYIVPGQFTADGINQQAALIDELRAVATQPEAVKALELAKAELMRRTPVVSGPTGQ